MGIAHGRPPFDKGNRRPSAPSDDELIEARERMDAGMRAAFPSLSPAVDGQPDFEKVNDSPTRMLNVEVCEIGDLVDRSMVKLTEWGGS